MKRLAVRIDIDQPPNGDCGPCTHVDCKKRATHVVVLKLNGVEAHTWVCDQHIQTLGGATS